MSLFYPQDHSKPQSAKVLYPGRSSDLPTLLTAFPSGNIRTVTHKGQKGPFLKEKAGSQRRARPRFSRGSLLSSQGAPESGCFLPKTCINYFQKGNYAFNISEL